MCGRYTLSTPPADLASHFGLDEWVDYPPRYNIHPGSDIAVIRHSPEGKRVLHLLRWGLVPHWATAPSIGNKLNNARAEGVAEKPAFRDAFKRRRCLIPADGFYEWQAQGKVKQPWFISQKSGAPLAMGGLWTSWRGPEGEILRTCVVITTAANALMAPIHERMPLILPVADWTAWLTGPAETAHALLAPYPAETLQAWPVSQRVNCAPGSGKPPEPPPEHPQGAGRIRSAAEAATATLGAKTAHDDPGLIAPLEDWRRPSKG